MDISRFRMTAGEAARRKTLEAQAHLAVGSTAEQQAKWILGLAERDLTKARESERAAFEIRVFDSYGLATHAGPPLMPARLEPKTQEVLELQERLQGFLAELGERGHARPPITLALEFWWEEQNGALKASTWDVSGGGIGPLTLFFANATRVLGEVRLHRCRREKCQKFFVPGRSDQRYCTKGCKDAVGQEAFRQRQAPTEARERRHQKYERAIRRKHPKAKIGRRSKRPNG